MQHAPRSTTRRTYWMGSEPCRSSYEALIRYCAAEGATYTLADLLPTTRRGRQAREAFLQRAEPHLVSVETAGRWPLGEPETGDPARPTPLWRCAAGEAALDVLLEGPDALYGWRGPKFPEYLAFYRADGTVLLGTIAHEHMAWMNLSDEEASDPRLGLVELRPGRL